MNLKRVTALLCLLLTCRVPLGADEQKNRNWAERLGYPSGKRVLILHADDVGMCYEANRAAKDQLLGGHIQSAAVMAPCPWFNEFVS